MQITADALAIVTKPYRHQQAAYDKLRDLLVAALLMEMGTGKSLVAIMLALRKLLRGRARHIVWFCPVTAKGEIRDEILKHVPAARVAVCDDRMCASSLPDTDFLVIGIESLSSSLRVYEAALRAAEGAVVILDEGDLIASPRIIRSRRLHHIGERAAYRYLLSGELVGEGMKDIYSPISWLSRRILGYFSWAHFAANHIDYGETKSGRRYIRSIHGHDRIAAKIAPYTYQVRKDECLDLPEQLWSEACYEMDNATRSRYEALKEEHLDSWDPEWDPRIALFRLIVALQRCLSGYGRDDQKQPIRHYANPIENPRIRTSLARLAQIPADRKVVIWIKYQWEADDLAAALEHDYPDARSVILDGRVPASNRSAVLQRFRDDHRFLLASQDLGSRMIDLTAAHYALYHSNTYSWKKRRQSESRPHRNGQTMPVQYIDIWCSRSVDDHIRRAHARKSTVAALFTEALAALRGETNAAAAAMKYRKMVMDL